jgi:hypothetical protein
MPIPFFIPQVMDNILIVISGRKRVVLFPPMDALHLYLAGRCDFLPPHALWASVLTLKEIETLSFAVFTYHIT